MTDENNELEICIDAVIRDHQEQIDTKAEYKEMCNFFGKLQSMTLIDVKSPKLIDEECSNRFKVPSLTPDLKKCFDKHSPILGGK